MSSFDRLSIAMQDEAIRIVEQRLNQPLSSKLKAKIRLPKWSFMGLEMIIDTVRTIDIEDLERYLEDLG
jgi:hypothetical protein